MIETECLILRRVDPEKDFEAWAKDMGSPLLSEHAGLPVICEGKVFVFGQGNPAL